MFNEKSIDVHGISLLSFLDMVVFEQKEGGGKPLLAEGGVENKI